MQCYRKIHDIKAISFDLDDTLYDNGPVLATAENGQLAYLHRNVASAQQTDLAYWHQNQRLFAKDNPKLALDLAELRPAAIYHGLLKLGLPDKDAHLHAAAAYNEFYYHRVKVRIDDATRSLLQLLAERYTLVALTNGTASIKAMRLDNIFEFALHAGQDGLKPKPYSDLFLAAAERLAIKPQQLLHVGNSLKFDIQGGLNAGCTTVWFNPTKRRASTQSALPHIEINDLNQLHMLL